VAASFTESIVEDAALACLLGYAVPHGPAIAACGVRIGTGARFVADVAE
jgi:hypothetical protein